MSMTPTENNPFPDFSGSPDGSFLPQGALVIKTSHIPGAGLGLFAGAGISPGTWICEYIGRKKSLIEVMRMEDRQYVMGTGRINCHIDATNHPQAFARYVNDNNNRQAINAEFVKIKQQRRVLLRATKEVVKGSEIYASYGEVFWRNRQQDMLSSPDTA